jgi:hypothetical protein
MKSLLSILVFAILPTAALADERPDPHRVHRLEFVVAESDGGKVTETNSYTFILEENHSGELRVGANVALQPSASRIDVGRDLRVVYTMIGDDLLLQTAVEISSAEDATVIRRITVKADALVSPGKSPALVTSLEDPVSHRRYQVTVTATRLR